MEKQEALPFPEQRAGLTCMGNFPSESHLALGSRRVVLLRVQSGDLVGAISQLQARSEAALCFWCAKLRMFFLFLLYFLSTGFHILTVMTVALAFGSHCLALLTIRSLRSPAVLYYHVVPGHKRHKVEPGSHSGSIFYMEERWDRKTQCFPVNCCNIPPCLPPLLTRPSKATLCGTSTRLTITISITEKG